MTMGGFAALNLLLILFQWVFGLIGDASKRYTLVSLVFFLLSIACFFVFAGMNIYYAVVR
jgi:hypothetical protein